MTARASICTILAIAMLAWLSSCMKRVPITEPRDYWWQGGHTWVKVQGSERWIRVRKVEADSVYGEIPGRTYPSPDTMVVIPLDSVEQIEREEMDRLSTLLSGIFIGGFVGFVAIGILVSKSFD